MQINDYGAIPSVDRVNDLLWIWDTSGAALYSVTPNSLLGISGAPLGTTDTQSPTNKTFDNSNIFSIRDDRLTLQDSADTAKQAQFQLSGITTGNTRVYTLPDFNGTLATLAGTETLTNKTLTSPVINTPTITNPTLAVNTISEHTAANGVTIDGLNIKDGAIGTNGVVAASISTGAVTPAKLQSGTGSGWDWQTWSPTLSGRLDDTKFDKTGRYIQIGKAVHFRLRLVANTTTPVGGSGESLFMLPATSIDYVSSDNAIIGNVRLLDAGTADYVGIVEWESTTTAEVKYFSVSGSLINAAVLSATAPFTWTTNDEIFITGCYEAA